MSSPEEHRNSLTLQKILPDEQLYIAVCLLSNCSRILEANL